MPVSASSTTTAVPEPLARRSWLEASSGVPVWDLIGLAIAFAWAMQPLPSVGLPFAIALAGSTLVAWSWLRAIPRPFPNPLNLKRTLLAPTVGALATLVLMALLREYYSGAIVVTFTALATLWMTVGRLAAARLSPVPRLLCVGETPWAQILSERGRAEVVVRSAPEGEGEAWSAILIDARQELSSAWLLYLARANQRGIPVVDGRTVTEQLTGQIDTDALDGRWANEIFHGTTRYLPWKRLFDLLATLGLLPFILPVMAVVAVLVRQSSPGPVLLWQQRIGLAGRPIDIVKFRTMRDLLPGEEPAFTSAHDPRITPIGQWLRRHRLDELPQFFNVLRGEMSIIGPRPEQAAFVAAFEAAIPLYPLRHNVRPGITGWAQVQAGYAADEAGTRTKLRYDLWYIKNLSLATDLSIALRTLRVVFTGDGSR
jgi:lipopolysaccharide/colanic/teichoic acid biosynthesis glycosyltransferase